MARVSITQPLSGAGGRRRRADRRRDQEVRRLSGGGGGGSGELLILAVPVERLAYHELIALCVGGGSLVGAVVGDRDRCRAAGLRRHDVERGEPVGCLQVAVGGPGRWLGRGNRGMLGLRAAGADRGDQYPVVRHVEVGHRCGR